MTLLFSKHCPPIGEINIRYFELEKDTELLHQWVTQPYAKYWGLQNATLNEVYNEYHSMVNDPEQSIYIGEVNREPAFLLEVYRPENSKLSEFIKITSGDRGMHILLAPAEQPISQFSTAVMTSVMTFIFSDQSISRVLVEPDCDNEKIHVLNRRVGFVHHQRIQLSEKTAWLGSCTRQQFELAVSVLQFRLSENMVKHPDIATAMIQSEVWQKVNRQLVRKALQEFCHERILNPECIGEHQQFQRYQLSSDTHDAVYHFNARGLALEHWLIDVESIQRYLNNRPVKLDAVEFVLEFNFQLNIPKDKLATYLEEITSTLYSSAYKKTKHWLSVKQLTQAAFQRIEAEMAEGHPCFVANNGRIGFDATDYRRFAPEAAAPIKLIWLAAHKSRCDFSHNAKWDHNNLIAEELDTTLLHEFRAIVEQQHHCFEDYYLIPVHPWQWFNKLAMIFATDLADGKLIYLGEGDDVYQAQQSIRTFYNRSNPNKHYVKTALSILNMGFMRGLSAEYMSVTPQINDWVHQKVTTDPVLQNAFLVLREIAAVGYRNPYYESTHVGNTPYKKMLSALWRESPEQHLERGQNLMTMAALLHTDPQGNALLVELIRASGLSVQQWLQQYFRVYLIPLVHCLYKHHLVFMPHGENLILVLQQGRPVKAIMKDIGEEVCLLNSDEELPDDVERIRTQVDDDIALLSIFTDVFDGFFRFMAATLVEQMNIEEDEFWYQVALSLHQYQSENPELQHRFEQLDIFDETFKHSCLNRLQLRNNFQMVDLSDPAAALQFSGELTNPIAKFKSVLKRQSDREKIVEHFISIPSEAVSYHSNGR